MSSYTKTGEREVTTHLPPYVFYYTDKAGKYDSIDRKKLSRSRTNSYRAFQKSIDEKKSNGSEIYESDVNVVYRLLEERFNTTDLPSLKISIIDIECDKDPNRSYSNVASPYSIVNAITIHNKWQDKYYTIVVKPETFDSSESLTEYLAKDSGDGFGSMTSEDGYLVVDTEEDLLRHTLEIISDADVISGWNSTFFDLPYLMQRVRIVLGGESFEKVSIEDGERFPFDPTPDSIEYLLKFNMKGFPMLPKMRMVERYGNLEKTFDIFGRVHLDYLELYRKFTFEELHSYTLDSVLELEIGQNKVKYEGTLDQLYRNDVRTFVAYSRQDVAGLSQMDDQLQMIQLANILSHMGGVTFEKVFGSVAIIQQAILRELHKLKKISFNKKESDEQSGKIPGAFVYEPTKGLYVWVSAYDINSLYPSVIRLLNISPETLIGQFDISRTEAFINKQISDGKDNAEAWSMLTGTYEYHDIIDENDIELTLIMEDNGDKFTAPAKEWKKTLSDNNWGVSANGTVFDLNEEGILSWCMEKWYTERKKLQKKGKACSRKIDECTDEEEKKKLKIEETYYDMAQLVMKIFLNSTYGALLNKGFRYYDQRLGKSVTLSGRIITKQMMKIADETIEYYIEEMGSD